MHISKKQQEFNVEIKNTIENEISETMKRLKSKKQTSAMLQNQVMDLA
jgi:hypothetical protein